jgi:predicted dehydrogenase
VHLPGYELLAPLGVQVTAVHGRNYAKAAAIARSHGVVHVHSDWRQLVVDPEIGLVSVATPPAVHAEVAFAALAAGKAVLCEKPLTTSLGAAHDLVTAAERARQPTAVNFSYRALPAFERAREMLAEGQVGHVLHAHVEWHVPSRLDANATWSWKDDLEQGGGALASYGVHALDYLEWLLGPVERVFGRLKTFVKSRGDGASAREVTSDDACVAVLEFRGGASATLTVSTASAGGRLHRLDIRGTEGRLVVQNLDSRDPVRPFDVLVATGNGDLERLVLEPPRYPVAAGVDPRVEPFAVHAAGLIAAVRSATTYTPSFAEGLRAQRLLDALRESAAAGTWVDLVDPPDANR